MVTLLETKSAGFPRPANCSWPPENCPRPQFNCTSFKRSTVLSPINSTCNFVLTSFWICNSHWFQGGVTGREREELGQLSVQSRASFKVQFESVCRRISESAPSHSFVQKAFQFEWALLKGSLLAYNQSVILCTSNLMWLLGGNDLTFSSQFYCRIVSDSSWNLIIITNPK